MRHVLFLLCLGYGENLVQSFSVLRRPHRRRYLRLGQAQGPSQSELPYDSIRSVLDRAVLLYDQLASLETSTAANRYLSDQLTSMIVSMARHLRDKDVFGSDTMGGEIMMMSYDQLNLYTGILDAMESQIAMQRMELAAAIQQMEAWRALHQAAKVIERAMVEKVPYEQVRALVESYANVKGSLEQQQITRRVQEQTSFATMWQNVAPYMTTKTSYIDTPQAVDLPNLSSVQSLARDPMVDFLPRVRIDSLQQRRSVPTQIPNLSPPLPALDSASAQEEGTSFDSNRPPYTSQKSSDDQVAAMEKSPWLDGDDAVDLVQKSPTSIPNLQESKQQSSKPPSQPTTVETQKTISATALDPSSVRDSPTQLTSSPPLVPSPFNNPAVEERNRLARQLQEALLRDDQSSDPVQSFIESLKTNQPNVAPSQRTAATSAPASSSSSQSSLQQSPLPMEQIAPSVARNRMDNPVTQRQREIARKLEDALLADSDDENKEPVEAFLNSMQETSNPYSSATPTMVEGEPWKEERKEESANERIESFVQQLRRIRNMDSTAVDKAEKTFRVQESLGIDSLTDVTASRTQTDKEIILLPKARQWIESSITTPNQKALSRRDEKTTAPRSTEYPFYFATSIDAETEKTKEALNELESKMFAYLKATRPAMDKTATLVKAVATTATPYLEKGMDIARSSLGSALQVIYQATQKAVEQQFVSRTASEQMNNQFYQASQVLQSAWENIFFPPGRQKRSLSSSVDDAKAEWADTGARLTDGDSVEFFPPMLGTRNEIRDQDSDVTEPQQDVFMDNDTVGDTRISDFATNEFYCENTNGEDGSSFFSDLQEGSAIGALEAETSTQELTVASSETISQRRPLNLQELAMTWTKMNRDNSPDPNAVNYSTLYYEASSASYNTGFGGSDQSSNPSEAVSLRRNEGNGESTKIMSSEQPVDWRELANEWRQINEPDQLAPFSAVSKLPQSGEPTETSSTDEHFRPQKKDLRSSIGMESLTSVDRNRIDLLKEKLTQFSGDANMDLSSKRDSENFGNSVAALRAKLGPMSYGNLDYVGPYIDSVSRSGDGVPEETFDISNPSTTSAGLLNGGVSSQAFSELPRRDKADKNSLIDQVVENSLHEAQKKKFDDLAREWTERNRGI